MNQDSPELLATTSNTMITFYDIAMRPPTEKHCCAVNPWKSRLTLNFKNVPYTTTWVQLPDIGKVRQEVGLAPCRKFADGTDFYTLPMIVDPTTNTTVGDSFDIAIYLQETYPNSGAGDLFPPQKLDYKFTGNLMFLVPLSERLEEGPYAEYARFNTNIDALFTSHVGLMAHGMPLDPATAEKTKAEFVRRAGVSSWDDLNVVGEMREKLKEAFRDALGDLAKLFVTDGGPFLLGAQQASYADMIVGGWLRMMSRTVPQAEWEEARGWHGGVFGRLHDALEKYAEVK